MWVPTSTCYLWMCLSSWEEEAGGGGVVHRQMLETIEQRWRDVKIWDSPASSKLTWLDLTCWLWPESLWPKSPLWSLPMSTQRPQLNKASSCPLTICSADNLFPGRFGTSCNALSAVWLGSALFIPYKFLCQLSLIVVSPNIHPSPLAYMLWGLLVKPLVGILCFHCSSSF